MDYDYINKSSIDVWVDQNKVRKKRNRSLEVIITHSANVSFAKINTFRVAFLLERICPPEYGLGAKFNETV